MLDKSVPYLNVLMCRPAGTKNLSYSLPEGYKFVMFAPGDEVAWADIEVAVLEFDTPEAAIAKLKDHYMGILDETCRRCVFIENEAGRKIATATIWWEYSGDPRIRRDPWVSYVGVHPEYQGRGLSNALISYLLDLCVAIEGDRDIYLHTQTWSHRAIKLYQKFGFYITKEPNLYKYPNDQYEEATAALEKIYAGYPKRG